MFEQGGIRKQLANGFGFSVIWHIKIKNTKRELSKIILYLSKIFYYHKFLLKKSEILMSTTSKVENFTQLYIQIREDFDRWRRTINATAFKINKFIWDYKDWIIFGCISVTLFIIAPYRFASGSAIFYIALKNNNVQVKPPLS